MYDSPATFHKTISMLVLTLAQIQIHQQSDELGICSVCMFYCIAIVVCMYAVGTLLY